MKNIKKRNYSLTKKITDFYKKNPGIKKSLDLFNISYSQYQKTLGLTYYYTSTEASPRVSFSIHKSKIRKK